GVGAGGEVEHAPAGALQVGEELLGDQHRRQVVDLHRGVDALVGGADQVTTRQHGGGVDHEVDLPGFGDHPFGSGPDVAAPLDVGAGGRPAEGEHRRAVPAGQLGDVGPDAVAAPEDHQGAAGQRLP